MNNKKLKLLTILGGIAISSGTNAQVYMCKQCPKDTYSNGKECVPCGEFQYSDVGSAQCTDLKYEIEYKVAEFTTGGQQTDGTLTPGFYAIILGGGNGGQVQAGPYYNSQGNGAQLQYVFKVNENTPYTLASGADGTPSSRQCSATGGGGGSWFKLNDTYYVAGGGGGSNSYNCPTLSSIGGWGGGVGGGGGGGYTNNKGYAEGTAGGASGNYKGGYGGYSASARGGNGQGPSGGYGGEESTTGNCMFANTQQVHTYGGRGGYLSSNGGCVPGGHYEVNEFVMHGGNGKTSHKSNTDKFKNLLCYHCAKLYKIK
ncbi:hypothetical protein HDR59_02010 [bacterium]|nr:hypothetical protein [bacterium]